MAGKNWRKIANREFRDMDESWQAEWQDLRERTS